MDTVMIMVLNFCDLDQLRLFEMGKNIIALHKLYLKTFYYAKSKNNCHYWCIQRCG